MIFIALTNYGYAQMVVSLRIINYIVLYKVSLLHKVALLSTVLNIDSSIILTEIWILYKRFQKYLNDNLIVHFQCYKCLR